MQKYSLQDKLAASVNVSNIMTWNTNKWENHQLIIRYLALWFCMLFINKEKKDNNHYEDRENCDICQLKGWNSYTIA